MADADELNPNAMQVHKVESSYTDVNGEPVKYTTDVWANSKAHAEQIQTDSLKAMTTGIKDINVTVLEPETDEEKES
jgi:hypothetical protein